MNFAEDRPPFAAGRRAPVYYGGNTIFTVTDLTLQVSAGAGTLTATLGGFLADRNEPDRLAGSHPAAAPHRGHCRVTLGELGLTVQPAYEGVSVTRLGGPGPGRLGLGCVPAGVRELPGAVRHRPVLVLHRPAVRLHQAVRSR